MFPGMGKEGWAQGSRPGNKSGPPPAVRPSEVHALAKAEGRGDYPGMEGTAWGPVAHSGAALMQGRPWGSREL